MQRISEHDAYKEAWLEIEEERTDKGVWAQAFAENGGDDKAARVQYLRVRSDQILAANEEELRVKEAALFALEEEKRQARIREDRKKQLAPIWEELEVIKNTSPKPDFDVNHRDTYGETLLMKAALRGDMDRVKYLLAWGADPDSKSNDQRTAAQFGRASPQLMKLLSLLTSGEHEEHLPDNQIAQLGLDKSPELPPGFLDNYLPVGEFAKIKGITENDAVQMIRDGFYDGQMKNGEWFVRQSEVGQRDERQNTGSKGQSLAKKQSGSGYLSVEEFAAVTGAHARDVIESIREGEYVGSTRNGQWFVSRQHLENDGTRQQELDDQHHGKGISRPIFIFILALSSFVVGLIDSAIDMRGNPRGIAAATAVCYLLILVFSGYKRWQNIGHNGVWGAILNVLPFGALYGSVRQTNGVGQPLDVTGWAILLVIIALAVLPVAFIFF